VLERSWTGERFVFRVVLLLILIKTKLVYMGVLICS